jgi:transposase
MKVARCGLDIAKQVFQVHCVDDRGHILLRKTLSRSKVRGVFATLAPCMIGMEACASAHYWGRELRKYGHNVHLMAAHFVGAYRGRRTNPDGLSQSVELHEAASPYRHPRYHRASAKEKLIPSVRSAATG